jgi:hypothetical protein
MTERQKGANTPGEIPDYFRAHTNETRLRLERATEQDVALMELVSQHAEAITVALAELTKFYRSSRPTDRSEIRGFLCEEVEAVWYVHKIMDGDIAVIRRLSPRIESHMPEKLKSEWPATPDDVYEAIGGSYRIVRLALEDVSDDIKKSEERHAARDKAVATLEDIRQRWSAIVITITTAQGIASTGKAG